MVRRLGREFPLDLLRGFWWFLVSYGKLSIKENLLVWVILVTLGQRGSFSRLMSRAEQRQLIVSVGLKHQESLIFHLPALESPPRMSSQCAPRRQGRERNGLWWP